MKRSIWIWALPGLVTTLAVVAMGWSGMERKRVSLEIENMFADHISSVAKLIKEGVGSATSSLALIYQMAEKDLQSCLALLGKSDTPHTLRFQIPKTCGLVVWLIKSQNDEYRGDWGPISEDKRSDLVKLVLQANPGEIIEIGSLHPPGLYCAYDIQDQTTSMACKSLDELSALRAQTGLGSLFRLVAAGKHPVTYAAIQDPTGVLASSEGAVLSTWKADPMLADTGSAESDHIHFRLLEATGNMQRLMEGLSPFRLPDGTTAVLRIGIDAGSLDDIHSEISQRHRLLVFVTVLFVMIVWIGTWFMNRWDRRRKEYLQKIARQEQIQREWQAIGQMAATVAHEVRNPLNTLKMSAQRLEREFKIPDDEKAEFKQLIQHIHGESERIDRVVGDFMEIGKPLILKTANTLWKERIEALVQPLRHRADQEGKKILTVFHGISTAELDPLRFDQIIHNLLINALDAIGPGQKVSIEGQSSKTGLIITIVDEGHGMCLKTLKQAQNAFFTTKSKGSGLGLPLARKLVEAHQGTIRIQSTPKMGTRVELTFPGTENGELKP